MGVQYRIINKRKGKNAQETFFAVPTTDEIIEQKTDKDGKPIEKNGKPVMINRTIRYVPGEESIYADKQSDDAKPGRILIQGSVIVIDNNRANLLEYMNKCNYNGTNEQRRTDINALFVKYDPKEAYQKALDKENLEVDALTKARTMNLDELKAYLLILNDRPGSIYKIENMSIEEVRHEAYRVARKDPKKFLEEISDVRSKHKLLLMQAISVGYIKYSDKTNSMAWSGGGEILRQAPGVNLIDTFLEKVRIDSHFSDIMDMIKQKLSIEIPDEVTPEISTPDIYVQIIERAVSAKIIERKANWYHYNDEKYNGYRALAEELKKDSMALFVELTKQVEEAEDAVAS